jgi:hypothetical protein
MNRSLADTLKIAQELLAIYKPIAGKKIGLVDGLEIFGKILAVLNAHQVTLPELQALLAEIGPFLPLLTAVQR